MQIWPFLQATFIAFGKSNHGQHSGGGGEELAWKQIDWIAERELELGIYQTDRAWAVISRPQGRRLGKATASQPPRRAPAPGCKQLLTLSPNSGSFLRLFSRYLLVWMLIPLTKLFPLLFSALFPLNLFLSMEKKKGGGGGEKKKKIPVSLVWPHLDLHWFFPCHSCYQQELAYGFKGKLRRRKDRRHFDGNKGQRNNLPSTKKLICVRFPKQSFQKPVLILGYTKKA